MIENWIIPCNIKHFDIISHFTNDRRAIWRNSFTMKTGDTAYIYLSAPYGEIKYRCRVVDDKVDEDTLEANSYAIPKKQSNNYFSKKIKYIVLELEYEFPSGTLTLEKLKEHGLGQVQIQARADRRVRQFIEEVTQECQGKEGEE